MPKLKVLRIEPASTCNLACIHCPTGTVDIPRNIMSDIVFNKVLENLTLYREEIEIVVLYHGGEPLLNRSIARMINDIKSIKSFVVKLVSNGMLLTDAISKSLLSTRLDQIEFSLDGLNSTENELIRSKSSTERVVSNISNFLALKKKFNHNISVVISTTQFVDQSKLMLSPVGVDNCPVTPKWLLDLFEASVNEFKPAYAMVWPHMNISDNFDIHQIQGEDCNHCDNVNSTMTVRADGTIVPCCYDLTSKMPMGNILKDDIKQLFLGSKYEALRENIGNKNYPELCASCNVVRPKRFLIPRWR